MWSQTTWFEVVGADGLAVADLAVLEPVVVAADAPVVGDLVAGGGGGVAAVAGVSAARAGGQALQQGRGLAGAGGELLVIGQAACHPVEGGLVDQGRDVDLEPVGAGAVHGGVGGAGGAPGLPGDPVAAGLLAEAAGLAEAGPAGVGGVAEHAPDRGAVPAGLAGAGGDTGAAQPPGQLSDGYALVGVAAEQPGDDGGLVRHDLIPGGGVIVLAHVPVPERGPRQHVHAAGPGALVLAAAGPFHDLRPLILGDHALELDQQGILGRVPGGSLEEHHRCARPGELLHQQRLVGVLAGQPVRGVAEHDVHRHLGHQVPEGVQGRAHQRRARVAVILEHPLFRDVKPQLPGVGAQRLGLGDDRLLLLLPGAGDPRVDRRAGHRGTVLPDRPACCERALRGP